MNQKKHVSLQAFPPKHAAKGDAFKYHALKMNANVMTSQHIVTEIS